MHRNDSGKFEGFNSPITNARESFLARKKPKDHIAGLTTT